MDDRTAARIAVSIVGSLGERDFIGATKRFDDRMRTGLPPDRLEQVWDRFVAENGAFTARGDATAERRGSVWACAVRLAFERAPVDLHVTVAADGTVAGMYLVPFQDPDEQVRAVTTLRRGIVRATPFMLAVAVAFAFGLGALGEAVHPGALLVGAGGWALALVLRSPFAVLARMAGRSDEELRRLMPVASGPLEEGVRLGSLAVAGTTLARAYSLGLGWAAIEIIYAIVNAFAAFSMAARDDDEAAAVRTQLAAQQATMSATPVWSVVERISATAHHVGASLLLAVSPWWVIATVAFHSGINVAAVVLTKRSIVLSELVVLAAGSAVFVGGLLAIGAL